MARTNLLEFQAVFLGGVSTDHATIQFKDLGFKALSTYFKILTVNTSLLKSFWIYSSIGLNVSGGIDQNLKSNNNCQEKYTIKIN